jgi:hypothetical protein
MLTLSSSQKCGLLYICYELYAYLICFFWRFWTCSGSNVCLWLNNVETNKKIPISFGTFHMNWQAHCIQCGHSICDLSRSKCCKTKLKNTGINQQVMCSSNVWPSNARKFASKWKHERMKKGYANRNIEQCFEWPHTMHIPSPLCVHVFGYL